jgi:hypothetical protein
MEKEFVPYELAVKLKTLGFDEPCFGYYVDGELRGINLGIEELGGIEPYYQRFGFHTLNNHDIDNPNKIVVTAPTFSQAFRWFREKYGMIFTLIASTYYYPSVSFINTDGNSEIELGEFETYEEAELACLEKLIEIVEQNQQ